MKIEINKSVGKVEKRSKSEEIRHKLSELNRELEQIVAVARKPINAQETTVVRKGGRRED